MSKINAAKDPICCSEYPKKTQGIPLGWNLSDSLKEGVAKAKQPKTFM